MLRQWLYWNWSKRLQLGQVTKAYTWPRRLVIVVYKEGGLYRPPLFLYDLSNL
jgi:hypothetical protein